MVVIISDHPRYGNRHAVRAHFSERLHVDVASTKMHLHDLEPRCLALDVLSIDLQYRSEIFRQYILYVTKLHKSVVRTVRVEKLELLPKTQVKVKAA